MEVQFTQSTRVLRGLDQIAAYCQVSPRTIRRWIDKHAFVAIRGPSAGYMTTTSLIDLWLLAYHSCQSKATKVEATDRDGENEYRDSN